MDYQYSVPNEKAAVHERTTSVPDTISTVPTKEYGNVDVQHTITQGEGEALVQPVASTGHEDLLADDPNKAGVVQYKTLNWFQCGVLMIAECISLGILSLPYALAKLGLVPGLLLILGLGIIAGYTGYIIGQFKLKHPTCTSMADAGEIIFGVWGREVFGIGQLIVLVFIMAAHITSFAIMMNVLTGHCTCTIWFTIAGLILSIICTMPRTLKNISFMSIGSCISIFTAVFIVMVSVGVQKPHPNQMEMVGKVGLVEAMNAALNIVLAYCGHVTYFGFASELKDPRDFTKSLIFLQTIAVTVYSTVAVVIYYYVGPGVSAPALSEASPVVRKVSYGIASVTIVIAGVVNGSVGAKQMYLRLWEWKKQPSVIRERSKRAYLSWYGIVFGFWFLAWIIAEAIPKFEYVLALVAALLSGWYSYGITSALWIHSNRGQMFANWRKISLFALNIAIFIIGCVISLLGLYTTGKAIHDGDSGKAFSCDNNDPKAHA